MQRVILLVQDDEGDALLVRKAFFKTGLSLTIEVARTAEAAIAYLKSTNPYADKPGHPAPAFILLDLSLSGMNAFEFLKWVRSKPTLNAIRIVVLTSAPHLRAVERAYELGANSFLTKPLQISNVEALAAVLRGSLDLTGPQSTTVEATE